jgi:hypothetical protein
VNVGPKKSEKTIFMKSRKHFWCRASFYWFLCILLRWYLRHMTEEQLHSCRWY